MAASGVSAAEDIDAPSSSDAPLPPPPQWYTAKRLLALFCAMQFLVYLDRGVRVSELESALWVAHHALNRPPQVIASTGVKGTRGSADTPGSGLAGYLQLSDTQDGALFSAFMVGLLLGSLAFAEASKYYNPFRIIALGLGAWVLATLGCAASTSFAGLFLCRCAAGLGEASFVSLASPFIDDAAPAGQKTRWLALFYMTIPVGVASGFILGKVVGDPLGWRAPFVMVSLAMVPFVLFCVRTQPLLLRGGASCRTATPDGEAGETEGGAEAGAAHMQAPASSGADVPVAALSRDWRLVLHSFKADVLLLLRLPLFVCTCAAWAAHTAVVGTFSYYGPKAAKAIFSLDSADTVFGALTVVTGIAGTLAGGAVLDKWKALVSVALQFCCASCAVAFLLLLLAFQAPALPSFIPLFACGLLALFSINACVGAAIMWSVPLRLRQLAISLATIAIHIFGDVPLPPIVGRVQDWQGNWRVSLGSVTGFLALSAALFHWAAAVARRQERAAARKGEGEGEEQAHRDDVPLLTRTAEEMR